MSFPGLGYNGPTDVAVAMFTFANEEAYRSYRLEIVATDPECQAMAALIRETGCFTRYERSFLQPVQSVRKAEQSDPRPGFEPARAALLPLMRVPGTDTDSLAPGG